MSTPTLSWFCRSLGLGAGLLLLAPAARAQVGIGTTTPDARAALEISATDKGLLIPRLTQAQRTALTSVPDGLMVFQTDATAGFWYYFGGSWLNLPTTATLSGDNLGNHTATRRIDLATYRLVGNGGSLGLQIANTGDATFDRGLTTEGPIKAGGNVSLSAYRLVGDAGTQGLSIDTNGTISTDGTLNVGDNLGITGLLNPNAVTTLGGNLNLSTFRLVGSGGALGVRIADTGAATFDAGLTTGGPITAGGNVSLGSHKLVGSAGTQGLSVTPSGSVSTDGDLTTGGALTTSGAITAGGRVNLAGNKLVSSGLNGLSISGGGHVTTDGTLTTSGTITAGGNVQLGANMLVGNGGNAGISIASDGSVTTAGLLTTGGAIAAGGAFTAGGRVNLGVFKLVGNSGTTGLGIASSGAATFDNALTVVSTLTTGGQITAGGNVNLSTHKLVGNGGSTGLSISSTGGVTSDADLTVNGAFSPVAGIKMLYGSTPAVGYYINNNYIAFGHNGVSADFLGYADNTFYLKDSPGGIDSAEPQLVVGGALTAGGNVTAGADLSVTGTTTIGADGTALAAVIRSTATVDLPSINSNNSYVQTVTVTGAVPGATVYVSPGASLPGSLVISNARVTANDTIDIKFVNAGGNTQDAPSMSYFITVIQ
ncbi:hypothetical protein EJV47_26430 [Hymenobacter gummosus]|uniref:Uncharacterized protein n=1 Tax=Hymenobacter gummosus TaxID=1776032 RepID=A0A431TV96_9BACT|nr:hypothetical protein [Hymenobacter gummosus]RTQ45110.1 hypothetical protein EJV47_26430 [Hymenobacter gummosus]